MKAALISIRPEWVQQILSGQKKIECRKTKPNLQLPFKVYIYCTYGTGLIEHNDKDHPNLLLLDREMTKDDIWENCCNGKVVGEFVCQRLVHVLAHPEIFAGHPLFFQKAIDDACMTQEEVETYSGGKDVIGWEISQLKIYDKPKLLSEFTKPYGTIIKAFDSQFLQRPPQSWCYVEELSNA